MIETALAWLIAIALTPYTIGALFTLAWFCERGEHYVTEVLVMVALATIAYFMIGQSIPANYVWYALAAYVPVGLVWSMYRWKRYVDKKVDGYNYQISRSNGGYSDRGYMDLKARLEQEIDVKEQVSRVTGWVLAWPISMLDNVLGDLVETVKRLITVYFRSVYDRITDSATKRIVPNPYEKRPTDQV